MNEALLNVLRAIAAGGEQHADATNYAIWVHSVVKAVLNDYEPTSARDDDEFLDVDATALSEVTRVLYDCFDPFGGKPLGDPEADAAFQSHLRRAAVRIIKAIPAGPTSPLLPWQDIVSAPQDGSPVVLLNATNGDQAIARLMPVKGEEPCWIFAQGVTNDNAQVSFRFENPTHWRPVYGDIPYVEPTNDAVIGMDVAQPVEPIDIPELQVQEQASSDPQEVNPTYTPEFIPEAVAEESPAVAEESPAVAAQELSEDHVIQLHPDEPTT